MSEIINKYRLAYPEFSDKSDLDLTRAVHQTEFSEVPFDKFVKAVGLKRSVQKFSDGGVEFEAEHAPTITHPNRMELRAPKGRAIINNFEGETAQDFLDVVARKGSHLFDNDIGYLRDRSARLVNEFAKGSVAIGQGIQRFQLTEFGDFKSIQESSDFLRNHTVDDNGNLVPLAEEDVERLESSESFLKGKKEALREMSVKGLNTPLPMMTAQYREDLQGEVNGVSKKDILLKAANQVKNDVMGNYIAKEGEEGSGVMDDIPKEYLMDTNPAVTLKTLDSGEGLSGWAAFERHIRNLSVQSTEALGSSLPSIIGGLAGGGAPVVIGAAASQVFEGTYEKTFDYGVNKLGMTEAEAAELALESASRDAIQTGSIEGLANMFQLSIASRAMSSITSKVASKGVLDKAYTLAKAAGAGAATEFPTEFSQSIFSSLIEEEYKLNEDKYSDLEITKQALYEGLVGAVVGAKMQGAIPSLSLGKAIGKKTLGKIFLKTSPVPKAATQATKGEFDLDAEPADKNTLRERIKQRQSARNSGLEVLAEGQESTPDEFGREGVRASVNGQFGTVPPIVSPSKKKYLQVGEKTSKAAEKLLDRIDPELKERSRVEKIGNRYYVFTEDTGPANPHEQEFSELQKAYSDLQLTEEEAITEGDNLEKSSPLVKEVRLSKKKNGKYTLKLIPEPSPVEGEFRKRARLVSESPATKKTYKKKAFAESALRNLKARYGNAFQGEVVQKETKRKNAEPEYQLKITPQEFTAPDVLSFENGAGGIKAKIVQKRGEVVPSPLKLASESAEVFGSEKNEFEILLDKADENTQQVKEYVKDLEGFLKSPEIDAEAVERLLGIGEETGITQEDLIDTPKAEQSFANIIDIKNKNAADYQTGVLPEGSGKPAGQSMARIIAARDAILNEEEYSVPSDVMNRMKANNARRSRMNQAGFVDFDAIINGSWEIFKNAKGKIADFTTELVKKFGESIKQFAKEIYNDLAESFRSNLYKALEKSGALKNVVDPTLGFADKVKSTEQESGGSITGLGGVVNRALLDGKISAEDVKKGYRKIEELTGIEESVVDELGVNDYDSKGREFAKILHNILNPKGIDLGESLSTLNKSRTQLGLAFEAAFPNLSFPDLKSETKASDTSSMLIDRAKSLRNRTQGGFARALKPSRKKVRKAKADAVRKKPATSMDKRLHTAISKINTNLLSQDEADQLTEISENYVTSRTGESQRIATANAIAKVQQIRRNIDERSFESAKNNFPEHLDGMELDSPEFNGDMAAVRRYLKQRNEETEEKANEELKSDERIEKEDLFEDLLSDALDFDDSGLSDTGKEIVAKIQTYLVNVDVEALSMKQLKQHLLALDAFATDGDPTLIGQFAIEAEGARLRNISQNVELKYRAPFKALFTKFAGLNEVVTNITANSIGRDFMRQAMSKWRDRGIALQTYQYEIFQNKMNDMAAEYGIKSSQAERIGIISKAMQYDESLSEAEAILQIKSNIDQLIDGYQSWEEFSRTSSKTGNFDKKKARQWVQLSNNLLLEVREAIDAGGISLDEIETALESQLTENELMFNDFIKEEFEKISKDLEFTTKAVYGRGFTRSVNYAPTLVHKFQKGSSKDGTPSLQEEEENLTLGDSAMSAFSLAGVEPSVTRESGVTKERVGIDAATSYYQPNVLITAISGMRKGLYDIHTGFERKSIGRWLTPDAFGEGLSGTVAHLRDKLDQVATADARIGFNISRFERMFDAFITQRTTNVMSSVRQLAGQASAGITHYIIEGGDVGIFFDSFKALNSYKGGFMGQLTERHESDLSRFMNTAGAAVSLRAKNGGYDELDLGRQNFGEFLESAIGSKIFKGLRKLNDIKALPVRIADGGLSRSIFLSYYVSDQISKGKATSIEDVNFGDIDWASVGYANRKVDANMNHSLKANKGEAFQDNSVSKRVVKRTLLALKSHPSMVAVNLNNALRDMFSGEADLRSDALKYSAAALGQTILFSAIRNYWKANVATAVYAALFDEEDFGEKEDQPNSVKIKQEKAVAENREKRDNRNKSMSSKFNDISRDVIGIVVPINNLSPIDNILMGLIDATKNNIVLPEMIESLEEDLKAARKRGSVKDIARIKESIEMLKLSTSVNMVFRDKFTTTPEIGNEWGLGADVINDSIALPFLLKDTISDGDFHDMMTAGMLFANSLGFGLADVTDIVRKIQSDQRAVDKVKIKE